MSARPARAARKTTVPSGDGVQAPPDASKGVKALMPEEQIPHAQALLKKARKQATSEQEQDPRRAGSKDLLLIPTDQVPYARALVEMARQTPVRSADDGVKVIQAKETLVQGKSKPHPSDVFGPDGPGVTPEPKPKPAAAGSRGAGKDASVGLLSPEIVSKIKSLAAEFPEASRAQFERNVTREAIKAQKAQPPPQPDQATAQAVDTDATLATVKGDATLLRQWHKYQQLLTAVVLPPDRQLFETLEDAANASNLAKTYFRVRERQAKVGVELVPENESYIRQVASTATLSYQKLKPKPDALVA